jgi:hypothetical protein
VPHELFHGGDDAHDIPACQVGEERQADHRIGQLFGHRQGRLRTAGEGGLPVAAVAPPFPGADAAVR